MVWELEVNPSPSRGDRGEHQALHSSRNVAFIEWDDTLVLKLHLSPAYAGQAYSFWTGMLEAYQNSRSKEEFCVMQNCLNTWSFAAVFDTNGKGELETQDRSKLPWQDWHFPDIVAGPPPGPGVKLDFTQNTWCEPMCFCKQHAWLGNWNELNLQGQMMGITSLCLLQFLLKSQPLNTLIYLSGKIEWKLMRASLLH